MQSSRCIHNSVPWFISNQQIFFVFLCFLNMKSIYEVWGLCDLQTWGDTLNLSPWLLCGSQPLFWPSVNGTNFNQTEITYLTWSVKNSPPCHPEKLFGCFACVFMITTFTPNIQIQIRLLLFWKVNCGCIKLKWMHDWLLNSWGERDTHMSGEVVTLAV